MLSLADHNLEGELREPCANAPRRRSLRVAELRPPIWNGLTLQRDYEHNVSNNLQ
jgi:hypothetical protein